MNLPNYHTILLDQGTLEGLSKQLEKAINYHAPLIINILHFKEKQNDILMNIESYFNKNPLHAFPYGLWILSDSKEYRGTLNIKHSIKDLPLYYSFKARPLNSKENIIFHKVMLKQKNIASIQTQEYQADINDFAKSHKKILNLYEELLFLQKTTQKVDIYYGKKRS